jgi:hypothetical protein
MKGPPDERNARLTRSPRKFKLATDMNYSNPLLSIIIFESTEDRSVLWRSAFEEAL